MNRLFVQELLKLENPELVKRKIREQRDEILDAIKAGRVNPDKALLDQLFELNVAAGDVPVEVEGAEVNAGDEDEVEL